MYLGAICPLQLLLNLQTSTYYLHNEVPTGLHRESLCPKTTSSLFFNGLIFWAYLHFDSHGPSGKRKSSFSDRQAQAWHDSLLSPSCVRKAINNCWHLVDVCKQGSRLKKQVWFSHNHQRLKKKKEKNLQRCSCDVCHLTPNGQWKNNYFIYGTHIYAYTYSEIY